MKRKIAFVTPIYLPAPLYGSDTFVRCMAEEFARLGHDTSVVTSDARTPLYWYNPFLYSKRIPTRYEVIQNVSVYRLPCHQLFSSSCYLLKTYGKFFLPANIRDTLDIMSAGPALQGLEHLLRREKFDVIHSSPFPLYLNKQVQDIARRLSRKPKVIVTPFFHTKVREYSNKELGVLLRSVDVVHAVTRAEKEDMVRMHGVRRDTIDVVPLFLNVRQLHGAEDLLADVYEFKRNYNIQNKKIVLFVGLKGLMKGAIDMLHAVYEMHKRDPNVVLVAMGHNTNEWENAKKSIDTNFLVDIGYTEGKEKEVIFASCDVYCMPSRSDSFGLVYLEAWHKKKPVIGARVPAMTELIQGNKGGLLVKFGSLGDIQSAIERLVNHPVLSKTLGEQGYTALIEKYTIESVFSQYRRMFIDQFKKL